ncbi:MAG: ABC transporter ATP-binding protein [Lachnospiraceae bacterium]|nr:ABC transporter ATP-binding protein [Lachnospiraceae bacterium]
MALFECRSLTKKKGTYRIDGIDFDLEGGSILGLIGINGCGKTTLLRTILGSYRIDTDEENTGELILKGHHCLKYQKEYRNDIAYVLQDCPFKEYMHAGEVGEKYGYYYRDFNKSRYFELLGEYGIHPKKGISELSKGQIIKMQLAFAQSYQASLYIFDEPAGNLDVQFRDEFYDLIRKLVSDEKHAVIISSHLVSELEHIADELLWMGREADRGFVRFKGGIDDLKNAYRLLSADKDEAKDIPKDMIAGKRIRASHSEYLLCKTDGGFDNALPEEMYKKLVYPTLQEIMYYVEKEEA